VAARTGVAGARTAGALAGGDSANAIGAGVPSNGSSRGTTATPTMVARIDFDTVTAAGFAAAAALPTTAGFTAAADADADADADELMAAGLNADTDGGAVTTAGLIADGGVLLTSAGFAAGGAGALAISNDAYPSAAGSDAGFSSLLSGAAQYGQYVPPRPSSLTIPSGSIFLHFGQAFVLMATGSRNRRRDR
jgi:hypothetical protein